MHVFISLDDYKSLRFMFIVSSLSFSTSPDGRSNTVRKYRKEKKRERERERGCGRQTDGFYHASIRSLFLLQRERLDCVMKYLQEGKH